jgi:hypothetical protein
MMARVTEPGFSVVPEVFSGGEVSEMLARLDNVRIARSRAGARHLMASPLVAGIAGDARMRSLRRVLHVEYTRSLSVADGLELAIA